MGTWIGVIIVSVL